MSRAEELLQQDLRWQMLCDAVKEGKVPGAVGIEISSLWQRETMEAFARRALCFRGDACGECPSCRAWSEGQHPDLLVAGEPDAPAPADECRRRAGDLSMAPVTAPMKLLVLYAPEKMTPAAVNSMLKITEEPPPKGRLLYLMNKRAILPTLRSRLWLVSLSLEKKIEPLRPPRTPGDWGQWLRENEKNDAQTWYAMAHGYAAWLCGEGDFCRAAQLRQLAETAAATHLSSAMWADILFLLLREEYPFEHVFDDFRQAALPGACRS